MDPGPRQVDGCRIQHTDAPTVQTLTARRDERLPGICRPRRSRSAPAASISGWVVVISPDAGSMSSCRKIRAGYVSGSIPVRCGMTVILPSQPPAKSSAVFRCGDADRSPG